MPTVSPQFVATVAEVLQLCAGGAAIFFTVHTVLAFAQSNAESMWGRPGALSDALEKFTPAVLAFVVAVSARSLGEEVGRILTGGAQDAAAVIVLWRALGVFVIRAVLMSISFMIAIGVASGSLTAQVAHLIGRPGALASVWERILLVAVTGGLALLSVDIARGIIQAAS